MIEYKKSNCHYCGYLCGFIAKVEDGRLAGLEPDPTRFPYDPSILAGCIRWRMNLEEIDSPQRINYPIKRVGKRGSAEWKRVSWDEALDEIATRLAKLSNEIGPHTLASAIGGPHASFWPLHRFLNLFGSPNNMGIGQICWNPRILIDTLTFGWPIEVDVNLNHSGSVCLWATNPADSDNSLFWKTIKQLRKQEIKLVVIDPRRTKTAKIADIHLAPRPGTDVTLALAMLNHVISSNIYDRDFVEHWCKGFDELSEHVKKFSPEYAEDICGVSAKLIREAAIVLAKSGPMALLSGRGIDQLGTATIPTHRAIAAFRAITGNVDKPGACLICEMSDFTPEIDLEMSDYMSKETQRLQLNSGISPFGNAPFQSYDAYWKLRKITESLGKRLPMRYLTSAHPNLVWRAAITGKPYPIKALIVQAANPLITYADTRLVHKAMQAMDLIVVLEYYMTPSAQLADFVLPIAGAFEKPLLQAHGGVSNMCYGGDAAVNPYYERRSDYDFFRELALRFGQEQYWPDITLKEAHARTLSDAGMSWETWKECGICVGSPSFFKHKAHNYQTKKELGFATSSTKVDLQQSFLLDLGVEEWPTQPIIENNVFINDKDKLPELTLITGARKQPYWASSYFNNARLRKIHPVPIAEMSAETMDSVGIKDNDYIVVTTKTGSAEFVAKTAEIINGVLSVDYGWWFPEKQKGEPHLSGTWMSNANILTSGDIEDTEPMIGSWTYNGIPCRVELRG